MVVYERVVSVGIPMDTNCAPFGGRSVLVLI